MDPLFEVPLKWHLKFSKYLQPRVMAKQRETEPTPLRGVSRGVTRPTRPTPLLQGPEPLREAPSSLPSVLSMTVPPSHVAGQVPLWRAPVSFPDGNRPVVILPQPLPQERGLENTHLRLLSSVERREDEQRWYRTEMGEGGRSSR